MTPPSPVLPPPGIRWVGTGDATTLGRILAASFEDGWTVGSLQTLLQMPGVFGLLIEEEDSAVAGFILCRVAADEAEILTLAVLPAVRRRGHGRTLLHEAIDVARVRGAARLFLEVGEGNVAARTLYEAAGLQIVGRRRGYYRVAGRAAEDALMMSSRL